jgi:hypothetical protein
MRIRFVLLLAACGGGASSRRQPVASAQVEAVAPVTCEEAGILLRGPLDDAPDPAAGPARERAIADACTRSRWSPAVLECIGSHAGDEAAGCLAKLTPAQRDAYDQALDAWTTEHENTPRVAAGGMDDHTVTEASCDHAVRYPGIFPPSRAADAPEQDWALARRRDALVHACEHDWTPPLRTCLSEALNRDDVDECLTDHLAASARAELVRELTELDELATKISVGRKMPGFIGCKQVVAAHYADAQWRNRLDGIKPAERKRVIVASRSKMMKACTADAWDETLRACVVSGGGETCFEAVRMALSWGYPAAGVEFSLRVAECDAYATTIKRVLACDKLPADGRDAIRHGFEKLRVLLAKLPVHEREAYAQSCSAGADAVRQALQSAGCP